MKYHETYGERLLRSRGLICQTKALFTPDVDDRREVKLTKVLKDIESWLARPHQRASGFSAFYAKFSNYAAAAAYQQPGAGARGVMVAASVLRNKFNIRQTAYYEALADREAARQATILNEKRSELQAQVQICIDRRTKDISENGLVDQVEICMCADGKQQQFMDRINSLKDEGVFAAELEQRELSAPLAPSAEEQELLIEFAQPFVTPLPMLPWFVPHICRQRDRFQGVVFSHDSPEAQVAYLFLYAHQRPFEAEFLVLRRRPRVLRLGQGGGPLRQVVPLGQKTYDYMPLEHISSHKLPFGEDDNIWVVTGSLPSWLRTLSSGGIVEWLSLGP
jgi:hypothetical protein